MGTIAGARGEADDGNMMAIGLQFRMKGFSGKKGALIQQDPKSIKQLRADVQALQNEHQGTVSATDKVSEVDEAA